MSKDEKKPAKASLPEILETDTEDRDEIVLLLEKCYNLKQQKETVEAEYDEVKEDLSALQKLSGLEGLRHNNIAFMVSHREGRETVDLKVLAEELVACNVDPTIIKQCVENATKKGQGYYVREIVDLNVTKKPRGKKGDWD